MEGLGIILWAVVVMAALMIALTLGVKAMRAVHKRRTKAKTNRLELALSEALATGEVHPGLPDLGNRELYLLAVMMIEYLSLLRGAGRDRLVRLSQETGLVEWSVAALGARGRWRRAKAAEYLGYFPLEGL